MSKQVADLYRKLADKLDEIASLEMQLETEKQIRSTTEEQLRLADSQIQILRSEKEELAAQSESFRLQAVQWYQKSLDNSEILTVVKNVFGNYTMQDFNDLESVTWEAKGLISSEDYDTMQEYDEEIEYADNLINLAEEVKLIKGEFFDESERGEDEIEQLIEF